MIRPATHADLDWMIPAGDRAALESPHYAGVERDHGQRYKVLARMLLVPELVCVNVVGDRTGFVIGSLEPGVWFTPRVAVQSLLWVEPSRRGSWRAWRLVASFENWARANGASRVISGTDSGIESEKTERFYRKLGYTVSGVQCYKEL